MSTAASAAEILLENAKVMQLRESTIFGMAIDPLEKYIIAASDFGHIFIHCIDDVGASRTLLSRYAPLYSLHFSTFNGASFVFCGGTGWICCWRWEDLLRCPGPSVPAPMRVFHCMQHLSTAAAAQHMAAADINSISSDSQSNSIFAGCGDGIVYQIDCQTGETINCFTGHDSFIHKVKVLGEVSKTSLKVISCDDSGVVHLWDPRGSVSTSRCRVKDQLHKLKSSVFGSNHRLWCGGLDVDESENFLYVGGGVEPVGSAAALGWTAVCHLGDGIRALCAAPLPSPVQEQLLQGDLVVCGGAQAAIRYLSSTSLDIVSHAPVSALSVFSMAVTKNSVKQFLAVGGTHPIVDMFSMRGSRPRSFLPS